MVTIINKGESLDKVLNRTQLNFEDVNATVKAVLQNVRENGDAALIEYAKKFDGTDLTKETVAVSEAEFAAAYAEVSEPLLNSLRKAKENILDYHKKQLVESREFGEAGKRVGWMMRPVSRAGVYVPGGTASYPSSVLMTVLPAVAAGVTEIVMTTPSRNGKINPLTLVAARECGVAAVYKVGGAQAIAAMAFGTESVPKVDVIAGPGNIYVTVAKKEVYGYVGIDMIAGPSEILILADDSANPRFLAADMLSQAEHDVLATAILITDSETIAQEVDAELEQQTALLPRNEIVKKSLAANCAVVVAENMDEAIALANRIAPEHLELCFRDARAALPKIQNAGAVFIGNYTPEPLGDYFAGPDHVLPTSGTAKFFSVLNAETFVKRISVIEYDEKNLRAVKDDIAALAECEGLQAHANAVKIRFEGEKV